MDRRMSTTPPLTADQIGQLRDELQLTHKDIAPSDVDEFMG